MKTVVIFIMLCALWLNVIAQAPQKMSYQAVVRNPAGELVINHAIGMKISILQGSPTGTLVFQEIYSPYPQTNANGLVSIEIGTGIPLTGTFSGIDWSTGSYYLKTETDPAGGTDYTIIGTSQLLSVPYALYSKTAENFIGMGNFVTIDGDQTISGNKTFSKDIKANGLTVGKGNGNYGSNTAIGFNALNSNTTGYSNTAAGYQSLCNNTEGSWNSASGWAALYSNRTGHNNTAFGSEALKSDLKGGANTAIGYAALYSDTIGNNNTAIGQEAGYSNTSGDNNVFLGHKAGYYETGSNKLFIDNQPRTSETDARGKALIYGEFNTDPANQVLTINGRLNVNRHQITNVADPLNTQDAATKAYVDALEEKILQLAAEIGVKDIHGNSYKAVKINTQVWMAENLKTTKFNDGTDIPLITNDTEWANLNTPGYGYYNNDQTTYRNIYGALYNWYTVNTGKLCPVGWHVPSDEEWNTLVTFLGGASVAGGKMKETGTTHWNSPNTGATNESGFSGLPGGIRGNDGGFGYIGSYGTWWSSTGYSTSYAWSRGVGYGTTIVGRGGDYKKDGFGIRCVRDN